MSEPRGEAGIFEEHPGAAQIAQFVSGKWRVRHRPDFFHTRGQHSLFWPKMQLGVADWYTKGVGRKGEK